MMWSGAGSAGCPGCGMCKTPMPALEFPKVSSPFDVKIDPDSLPDLADYPLYRSKNEQLRAAQMIAQQPAGSLREPDLAVVKAKATLSTMIMRLDAFRQELVELKRSLA